jgi:solute carrier family 6 serotonin transporter-like protein 4
LSVATYQYLTENTYDVNVAGIGFAICIIASYIAMYYNTIIAWSVYYMFASMRSEVPWKRCGHEWNTDNCSDCLGPEEDNNATFMFDNESSCAAQEIFKSVLRATSSSRIFSDVIT